MTYYLFWSVAMLILYGIVIYYGNKILERL